jgi:heat-inducible transcriptional repressor
MITARQRALLATVIERYVETAEPVGSSALARDARVTSACGVLSSATIRNDLADLETEGFLAHPHTSAGRVPTDAGYRLYINEMMRPRRVRAGERAQIKARIAAPASSVEDALQNATALLTRMTGYPAMASLPGATSDTMRHVQLNPLPPHRLLLVLVTGAGRIEHRLLEVGDDINAHQLNVVANFLDQNLRGKTLAQLRAAQWDNVSVGLHDTGVLLLARRAWDLVQSAVGEMNDEQVVVQGLLALLDEPEFSQIERARAAMKVLQDAATLGELLRATGQSTPDSGGRAVVIGSELRDLHHPALENFSFVGITYGAGGEVLGTVGVLGPTRMKYAEAVALVPALAGRLQESLESL